jgi:hypothetical protein
VGDDEGGDKGSGLKPPFRGATLPIHTVDEGELRQDRKRHLFSPQVLVSIKNVHLQDGMRGSHG